MKVEGMKCRKCNAEDVYLSRRRKWYDFLPRWFGFKALRCDTCRHRFFGRVRPKK